MAIAILIIFLLMVGGAAFLVVTTMKKLNATDGGAVASTKSMDNAQAFLPFVDINDDLIDLGGFKYRAIIECTSVNYALKTEAEKNIIESSFRNFLNTLQYPISFYIQTKELNYAKILETLAEDVEQTKIDCPALENYSKIYYEEISHLKETIQNSKQKKKYIIIPYEDTVEMNELSPKEKEEYSKKELHARVSMIVENLSTMGIKGTRLDTRDLIELMYSIYHRDDDAVVENIVDGDYLETIVSGLTLTQKQDALQKAISILQETESKLRFGVINDKNPKRANELFLAITKNINELKGGLTDIENRGGLTILSSDEELFERLNEESRENEEMFNNIETNDYGYYDYHDEGGRE
jgi:hypothetical protein